MATKTPTLQIVALFSIFSSSYIAISADLKFPAVFNFGDSNSDTGELNAGLGFSLPPPYGETYFKEPSGRFCNGRLIIDFLVDAMGLPFINPYLEAVGAPKFQKGCNFAAAGSTILPATAASISPFSFRRQVYQFLRFKTRTLALLAKGHELDTYLPAKQVFQEGLYMFDIGQNDIGGAFYSKTLDQVLALIPSIVTEFEAGIQILYEQGGKNFWIHNTGPVGCLAIYIAKFGTDPSELDELGCVKSLNQAAVAFNEQLNALCSKLKGKYLDGKVTCVDIFPIKLDLIANHSTYGFREPIMACCGYGGAPLNYDSGISCGQTKVVNGRAVKAQGCKNSDKYVNWDGIHYTESANHFVALKILSGNYSC